MATQGLLQRKLPAKVGPFYTNLIGFVSFTVGVEATNVIRVSVQAKTPNGINLGVPGAMNFWLSDLATGIGITATAPSSGIAVGTAGAVIEAIADKYGTLITSTAGLVNIDFSEAGVATWYLVVQLPDGSISVSGAITFA